MEQQLSRLSMLRSFLLPATALPTLAVENGERNHYDVLGGQKPSATGRIAKDLKETL